MKQRRPSRRRWRCRRMRSAAAVRVAGAVVGEIAVISASSSVGRKLQYMPCSQEHQILARIIRLKAFGPRRYTSGDYANSRLKTLIRHLISLRAARALLPICTGRASTPRHQPERLSSIWLSPGITTEDSMSGTRDRPRIYVGPDAPRECATRYLRMRR